MATIHAEAINALDWPNHTKETRFLSKHAVEPDRRDFGGFLVNPDHLHSELQSLGFGSGLDASGQAVSHRVFRKLSSNEVSALANHYGSNTPPSGECTLAEIFSETIAASKVSPRVGFGLS